jgi:transcriptional regulator with XRE-family HTH domain
MDFTVLRDARTTRGLSLEKLCDLTKLSPRVVSAIENGQLEKLPGGIYARTYLRTYAEAVGFADPAALEQLIEALPVEEVDLPAIVKCREDDKAAARRYRRAAILDTAVVLGISAAGMLGCAALIGARSLGLVDLAIAFGAVAGPTLVLYFGLLGAPGVGTAGARWFGVDFLPPMRGPIDLSQLLRRTRDYCCSEAFALLTGKIA